MTLLDLIVANFTVLLLIALLVATVSASSYTALSPDHEEQCNAIPLGCDVDCGDDDDENRRVISEADCLAKNCCYDELPWGEVRCYHADRVKPGPGCPRVFTVTTTTTVTRTPGTTIVDPDVCTGSLGNGCGCKEGYCYRYNRSPADRNTTPWCWTQRRCATTTEPNGRWAKCTADSQCDRNMVCATNTTHGTRGSYIDRDALPGPDTITNGNDVSDCDPAATTTTITSSLPSTTPYPSICNGSDVSGCGCVHGRCYRFLTLPARHNAPWCLTLPLGFLPGHGQFATCTGHTQCSAEMACGDHDLHVGAGVLPPPPTTPGTDPNTCTGTFENGCGCDRGLCYRYLTVPAEPLTHWCWAHPKPDSHRVVGSEFTCLVHSDCHLSMVCRDNVTYVGYGRLPNPEPHILEPSVTTTPRVHPTTSSNTGTCTGNDVSGCGCDNGFCYRFLTIPARPYSPWCYTQWLGIAAGQGQFATCRDHSQCKVQMTCGDDNRLQGCQAGPVTSATNATGTVPPLPTTLPSSVAGTQQPPTPGACRNNPPSPTAPSTVTQRCLVSDMTLSACNLLMRG